MAGAGCAGVARRQSGRGVRGPCASGVYTDVDFSAVASLRKFAHPRPSSPAGGALMGMWQRLFGSKVEQRLSPGGWAIGGGLIGGGGQVPVHLAENLSSVLGCVELI